MAIDDLPEPENLTGPQKAAIFLLAMGEEFAKSIFKKLDGESIKEIAKYMSQITYIPSNILNTVMNEFTRNFDSDVSIYVSGKSFLEKVATGTLDKETGQKIYEVGDESAKALFSGLEDIPADSLSDIIKGEHPQTIAIILSYLAQAKASETIGFLPEEIKADVALRIVKAGKVQDDIIRDLDEALKEDLSRIGVATRKFDGVETLVNILTEVDGKTEDCILTHIEKEDPDLAEVIRQKMFLFEDFLNVGDKSFSEILRHVDTKELAKSLKTASEELQEKIYSSLSERAAKMLGDDFESLGPVRLREVEEAQQSIIRVAKRLEAEGKIFLGKGKEEVYV